LATGGEHNRTMTVAGVVLAAGAGRRFGMPKALVRVGERNLLERAIATLCEAGCDRVVVVLGAQADDVRRTVSLRGVTVVVNEEWAAGMSTSLRAALRACSGDAAAVVLLVDQPGVPAVAVRRLVDAWRDGEHSAVAATYGGELRNPVLFDAAVFEAVAGYGHGDVGAKPWLRAHPDQVATVEVGDVADAADIDTPDDVARWSGS
jgi:CTP:molybdopterin cytidylyltransferase MocA